MTGLAVAALGLAWRDVCLFADLSVKRMAQTQEDRDRALKKLQGSRLGDFITQVMKLNSTGNLIDLMQAYPEGCDVGNRNAELGEMYAKWALEA